ncbi:MAG: DNA replication and repair protein RecF [Bacteroidales bacterium]|nr:DNA replication and repair protein RecF [Bacteroidales bacterium]
MQLKSLSLVGFKNYSEITVNLHSKLTCFVGDNGVGKTNLLDSIYYLCMCKSFFNASDTYSIKDGDEFMMLQGKFEREGKSEDLYCGLKRGKKKVFRRNSKEYDRLSDHIGIFPVVMVSPSDIQLITEGSEERRKYMNGVISQYDKTYLEQTIHYNHVLAQRNKYLKETGRRQAPDDLLDVLDEQLIAAGNIIFEKRKDFVSRFLPVFERYYHGISGGHEAIELEYKSPLNQDDFAVMLREARGKDLQLQFSTVGVHRDDLVLNLEGRSIKNTGSQGQQKTFLVSLKFAQFVFLKELKGMPPLLLLDDVFDKLDAGRVKNILRLVHDESFGQIFITHTNMEAMQGILAELDVDHLIYKVSEGALDSYSLT